MIHVPIIFPEKIIQFRQILAVYKINNLFLFFISSKVFSFMAKNFNLHLTQMAYIFTSPVQTCPIHTAYWLLHLSISKALWHGWLNWWFPTCCSHFMQHQCNADTLDIFHTLIHLLTFYHLKVYFLYIDHHVIIISLLGYYNISLVLQHHTTTLNLLSNPYYLLKMWIRYSHKYIWLYQLKPLV